MKRNWLLSLPGIKPAHYEKSGKLEPLVLVPPRPILATWQEWIAWVGFTDQLPFGHSLAIHQDVGNQFDQVSRVAGVAQFPGCDFEVVSSPSAWDAACFIPNLGPGNDRSEGPFFESFDDSLGFTQQVDCFQFGPVQRNGVAAMIDPVDRVGLSLDSGVRNPWLGGPCCAMLELCHMDDVVTLVVGDFGKSFGCEQESTTFFADDLSVVFNLERFGLLTRHLKRADFFDVEKYPNASFVSTKIELRRGPKGATHQVSGDLTIHGVTRPVNFPARITLRRDAVSHDRTLTISQTSFGMPDAAQKTQDDVPITVSVNATRS